MLSRCTVGPLLGRHGSLSRASHKLAMAHLHTGRVLARQSHGCHTAGSTPSSVQCCSAAAELQLAPGGVAAAEDPGKLSSSTSASAKASSMRVVAEAMVLPQHEAQLLPQALCRLFPDRMPTATAAKRACRRREVQVDDSVGSTTTDVHAGQRIRLLQRFHAGAAWAGSEQLPGLEVVFQDAHLACVIKPQGLPTQGRGTGTAQGRLKYCLEPSDAEGALYRPHQVHRLDAPTGGLLLVAKTRSAMTRLSVDLQRHVIRKRYVALVAGHLEGSGTIHHPLSGQTAITHFEAVGSSPSPRFGHITRVHLWPQTGRQHQLRRHMAYIGHPLLGDATYWRAQKEGVDVVQCSAGEAWRLGAAWESGPAALASLGLSLSQGSEKDGQARCESQVQHHDNAAAASITGSDDSSSSQQEEQESDTSSSQGQQPDVQRGGVRSQEQAAMLALSDGVTVPPLCLWAVQLKLHHPSTQQPLHLQIADPTDYDTICQSEHAAWELLNAANRCVTTP